MKIIYSSRMKKMFAWTVGICLLAVVAVNAAGYFFDCKYISVFAAVAESDQFEVRSQLLTEAMNDVGVCNPEDAALTWGKGLKERSGALQFAVMTTQLKAVYAAALDKNAPNWVTGISSPFVTDFRITGEKQTDSGFIIDMAFQLATSTGPAGSFDAQLTIVNENGFWRIDKITADPALYPYMGFVPPR